MTSEDTWTFGNPTEDRTVYTCTVCVDESGHMIVIVPEFFGWLIHTHTVMVRDGSSRQ